jgi:hypothetical protein
LRECWDEACAFVGREEKATRALARWLAESELTGTEAEMIAQLCSPQEALNEVRVRPYKGVVTAARSGASVPTYEADDPASIALYHRAAAFWHSMRAR